MRTNRRSRSLATLVATACTLVACGQARDDRAAYGPPDPRATASPAAPEARVPPAYAPTGKATDATLALRQTRLDAGDATLQNWEVSLAVRAGASADADEVVASWMTGRQAPGVSTVTRMKLARSSDGGGTFAELPLAIPPQSQHIQVDPALELDAATGRFFLAGMGVATDGSRTLWISPSTGPGGAAFAPAAIVPTTNTLPDKPWLASGPMPNNAPGRVLYYVERGGAMASVDGGATWSAPVRPASSSNPLQPEVFPDGTLAIAYYATSNQALFARSNNLGRTFTAPRPIHTYAGTSTELVGDALPGGFRAPSATMFARDPRDGRLYAVLHDVSRRATGDADVDVLLFSSSDEGTTWSPGRVLAPDAPAFSDQFLPVIEIDPRGGMHVVFYDTRRTTGRDDAESALVDIWYARSADRGETFAYTRLTASAIPSDRTRWSPIGNLDPVRGQFLGDYIALALSPHAAYVGHPVFDAGVVGMTLSRIDLDAAATTAIRDPRGLTGPWYEPATAGQGVEFHWIEGDRLLVLFYGHRDDGANFFVTGVRDGRFDYGQSLDIPLVAATGGRYNNFDASAIRRPSWGRITVRFDSCSAATARLDGIDGVKEMRLERLSAPALPCD